MALAAPAAAGPTAPDDGTGTVNLEDLITIPMYMTGITFGADSVPPPDWELECDLDLSDCHNFQEVFTGLDGECEGTVQCDADFDVIGLGDLAGFSGMIDANGFMGAHAGPRTLGAPVQTFDTNLLVLEGGAPPDPNFQSFWYVAGSNYGTPCLGQVTLTKLPDGDYNVDSSFDISYMTGFEGAVGGPLDGYDGVYENPVQECLLPICGATIDGWMCHETVQCQVEFGKGGVPAIPAGFFGPGSDPFDGGVPADAAAPDPYDSTDTLIARAGELNLPRVGDMDTTPIEIVALSLQSTDPIVVTGMPGGDVEFDVSVDLSPTQQQGELTATRTHINGGTYQATLPVMPRFTFTEVGNPGNVLVFDFEAEALPPVELNSALYASWMDHLQPDEWDTTPLLCLYDRFFPLGQLRLTNPGFTLWLIPATRPPVPEPGGLGLIGLVGISRRRRRV